MDGSDLHLVSYYTPNDIRSGRLENPNSRQDIMRLDLSPEIFFLEDLRIPPKVEIGPNGQLRLV